MILELKRSFFIKKAERIWIFVRQTELDEREPLYYCKDKQCKKESHVIFNDVFGFIL